MDSFDSSHHSVSAYSLIMFIKWKIFGVQHGITSATFEGGDLIYLERQLPAFQIF